MYPNNFNNPNYPQGFNQVPTQMNQFQQPVAPYYNPYLQTANNLQQQNQQSLNQVKGINGRIIGNVNEVTPNEVPMDGNVSLFPMSDYSCIYAKMWNTDGTIQTIKFIPVVENAQETQQAQQLTDAHYNNILERLDKIEQMLAPKKTNSRATKKEEVNE